MDNRNGGPAFPAKVQPTEADVIAALNGVGIAQASTPGMSLRDYFAARLAPSIWSQFQNDGTARQHDNWHEGVAIESYRIADEMIEARDHYPSIPEVSNG